jgi:hypothetical protein
MLLKDEHGRIFNLDNLCCLYIDKCGYLIADLLNKQKYTLIKAGDKKIANIIKDIIEMRLMSHYQMIDINKIIKDLEIQ